MMNLGCIANVITVVFQLTALCCIVAVYALLLHSKYDYIDQLAKNWAYGPVLSITQSEAPTEYLIKDYWPGTVQGCISGNDLSRGSCGEDGGETVPPVLPIQYTNWKYKCLCGARIQKSYLELSIAIHPSSCPVGERSCGIIDSQHNVLCLPSSSKCPINYIGYIHPGEQYPIGLNVTDYINFTDGQMITSNEITSNGKILNEFKFSEDIPCANPYYVNSISKPFKLDPYYDRDSCKEPIGTYKYDTRYTKLDTSTKDVVYISNGIKSTLLKVPLSDYYPSDPISLYTRSYIGMSTECLNILKNNADPKTIISNLSQTKTNIVDATNWACWELIVNSSVIAWFIVLAVVLCIEDCRIQGTSAAFLLVNFIIVLLGALLALSFNCVESSLLFQINSDYKFLQDPDCVDNLTYLAAYSFYITLNVAKSLSIVTLISNGISIVSLTLLIFSPCFG